MQRPNANPLVFELDVLDEHVHALQEDKPIATFGLDALNSILGGVYPGLNYAIGTAPGRARQHWHSRRPTSSRQTGTR